ncbi:MAG: hypothetical protein K6E86_03085 [Bacteroidales bacterium]|nr:hypothetical protein [Bacteroidales bacterium]
MKKVLIVLLVLLGFVACNTPSQREQEYYFTKDIASLTLYCDSFDLKGYFSLCFMDDVPEDLLRQKYLAKYRIESQDTLSVFQKLLHQSILIEQDSDMTCDTDVAALVEYVDGTTDTLSIPISLSRGFILGMKRFDNRAFIDSVLHALAFRDSLWKEVLERTYWKGDYKYYKFPAYDEDKYIPNYGMFANTKAETLARYMCQENIDSIVSIVKRNPSIMYARDAKERVPLVLHCILFQQDTVLKTLLDLGFDPNRFIPREEDELKIASNCFAGSDVNPFIDACENSYYNKCGKLLVQYGANVNMQFPNDGLSYCPLSSAISGKNYEMAKFLIEHGADVNSFRIIFYADDMYHLDENTEFKEEREYPIDMARKRNYLKMIYLLLTHGANIDTPYSRRVGDLHSYIESLNPDEFSSTSQRYLQKIKSYLKELDSAKKDNTETDEH